MTVFQLFHADAIVADLTGNDAQTVFAELCAPLARSEAIPVAELVAALAEREALASTALGNGVAIPHGVHPALTRIVASFGRSRAGVPFASPDGEPVHLFVALVRPPEATSAHLKALARVSHLLASAPVRAALLAAHTAEDIQRILAERGPGGGAAGGQP